MRCNTIHAVRTQQAEDEISRLQGVLSAMHTVMQSLRGHGSEERERLRQEHDRLQQLQTAVTAEGESLRADVAADRRRLAERWTAFEDAQKAARSEVYVYMCSIY
jgi:TolA-binding protein